MRTARADLGAALFVLGLGLMAAWQSHVIPPSPIYAQVGPTLVPWLVTAVLLALGVGLTATALRGGWSQDIEELAEAPPLNRRALALLLAGLLANLVLIVPLGFTVAASAQFVLVAAAFGSRALLRNLVIAFIVALSAYGLFVKGLGVNIGAGVVEALVFGEPG
ncbi:tripartite tricarboxylate transporter TctB family protein [Falsiroseomonas selenitidurans]|uniref:Tripartite tricarboxylate transporter TctB family protein n=1 Tax=Falsiroseomonas selenitidurans TaxID=2716335 RepID=A0ABX1E4V4_9PROT|nr:tripartite tricarboxylate transporter TctB family protein [Falsiroseomonas selenitidurans]NKC32016.1 tripartite tricarboxylate transporter TctB family protein [Falsiroseomonas selenitidurans]